MGWCDSSSSPPALASLLEAFLKEDGLRVGVSSDVILAVLVGWIWPVGHHLATSGVQDPLRSIQAL